MKKIEYTPEQESAVNARGNVIVSASAGSGKTFVMIERFVSLILGGADVRRVLAVTFTKKAAAQMKEKLRTALLKKIAESSGEEKKRLKEQLAALPIANISTLHSFCGRIVRSHFFLAGTDVAFRIIPSDGADGKELSKRAVDEAFERAYESGGESFRSLLAVYFRKKKDAQLRKTVLSLYESMRGLSDYRERLVSGASVPFEEICAFIARDFKQRAQDFAAVAQEHLPYFDSVGSKASAVCREIIAAAQAIICKQNLFEMVALSGQALKIPSMPSSTKATGELLHRLKETSAASAGIKEVYKALTKYATEDEERTRYDDACVRARALSELILYYDEAYSRLKKEKGVLDYNDLEHFAIKVLSDEETRKSICERYDYVFVDEYQDVNPAQEKIISLVSSGQTFLVGDRKQSIYAFRGSKSEYFTQKTQEFEHCLKLTENFRSAVAVLDAVNLIFTRAMERETCGFSYASDSVMRGGRRYGEHQGAVLFHQITKEKQEKEERRLGVYSVLRHQFTRAENAQADAVARIIEEEVGSEWYDADEGCVKTVSYGDIAVLVRKTSGNVENMLAELSERDIPVTTTAKTGIENYWEVRLLLDWLSYLDNTEQDIPLATAMLSSIGGFTEDDLAAIRLRFPSAYFFRAACKQYTEKMADGLALRLKAFAQKVSTLRAIACVRTAGEVICRLLAEGLETQIASKKDGRTRLCRVRRLLAEATGSVHEFLYRINRIGYEISYSEPGGENAVQVLSMHASKGLEYPVVILVTLDESFHSPDSDEVIWTEQFGLAPKSYEVEKKIMHETVARRATVIMQERETVKDEMNLLYVAMTRARYRLHAVFSSPEYKGPLKYAKRFTDFFDFAACSKYFITQAPGEYSRPTRKALAYFADGEKLAQITAHYQTPYPFERSKHIPVKSSATELMHQKDGEGTKNFVHNPMTDETTSIEEGTAYHAFLQYVTYGEPVQEEIERMVREGLVPPEQIALLSVEKLERMMQIPCLHELKGKTVLREQTFLVELPWREMTGEACDDTVVFQGAIDLLCIDERGVTLIDYKYSRRGDEALRREYAVQIALYKKAIARAMKIDERTIRARIVNILQCREIQM